MRRWQLAVIVVGAALILVEHGPIVAAWDLPPSRSKMQRAIRRSTA
ncbi:MAG: hypothetical protein WA996_04250 [Candidatus Promineifilaceae bacterium]